MCAKVQKLGYVLEPSPNTAYLKVDGGGGEALCMRWARWEDRVAILDLRKRTSCFIDFSIHQLKRWSHNCTHTLLALRLHYTGSQ